MIKISPSRDNHSLWAGFRTFKQNIQALGLLQPSICFGNDMASTKPILIKQRGPQHGSGFRLLGPKSGKSCFYIKSNLFRSGSPENSPKHSPDQNIFLVKQICLQVFYMTILRWEVIISSFWGLSNTYRTIYVIKIYQRTNLEIIWTTGRTE